MLRTIPSSRKKFDICMRFCRTLLSSEYKDFVNKYDVSTQKQGKLLLPAHATNEEINYFNNTLYGTPEYSEREIDDITEQIFTIRSQKTAINMNELTSFAVVQYYVKAEKFDQLVTMLKEPNNYGIFVNPYTSCYLMDLLHKTDIAKAAHVAAVIPEEDFANEIVRLFAIKSIYDYVKSAKDSLNAVPVENTEEQIKVRVKFLRNNNPTDVSERIKLGKALLSMAKYSKNEFKSNTKALGLLLSEHYEELLKHIGSESATIGKDVLLLCQDMAKSSAEKGEELGAVLAKQLELSSTSQEFGTKLSATLEQAVKKGEIDLINQQKQNFLQWEKENEAALNEHDERMTKKLRNLKINDMIDDININKQKIWSFDLEDKLDLQIYSKQVRYPKRWFGKKKKPRATDDAYIPPMI